MPSLILTLLLTLTVAIQSFADSRIKLGEPEINGIGCSKDTVGVTISPDQSALTLLFDGFIAEAGPEKHTDKKHCRINIPLELEKDETIAIFQLDYRGYNFLPKDAVSKLTVDSWFGGKEGPGTRQRFMGEKDGEYLVTDTVIESKKNWAPCGKPIKLHVVAGIDVRTNQQKEQAMISIDTLDVTRGITYRLQRRKCRRHER